MLDVLTIVALVAATVAMGLFAGLFWTFSVAVMPGLRQVDARTFVGSMQRVNVAIVNPVFLLVFLGAPVLTIVAGVLQLGADDRAPLPWIVAGFVLSAAAFVTTARANIPLNNALDAAGHPDQVGDLEADRVDVERLRAVDVGHRDGDQLQLVVHAAALLPPTYDSVDTCQRHVIDIS